ncbi:MAG: TerB family tellurite resistance protein [Inquilinaceae bacterium]
MLNRIKDFLADRAAPDGTDRESDPDELHLAVAALLVEAARMDDGIEHSEVERIAELLRWRFDLPPDDTARLIEEAKRVTAAGAQWYGFTAKIRQDFSETQRVQLMEMLWDVAHADGVVHDLEANLMRRIAGLLYVSDQDNGSARKRARERHGLGTDDAAG